MNLLIFILLDFTIERKLSVFIWPLIPFNHIFLKNTIIFVFDLKFVDLIFTLTKLFYIDIISLFFHDCVDPVAYCFDFFTHFDIFGVIVYYNLSNFSIDIPLANDLYDLFYPCDVIFWIYIMLLNYFVYSLCYRSKYILQWFIQVFIRL